MNEAFELWDEGMGNVLAWGETQEEVLAVVRSHVDEHGPTVAHAWSLLAVTRDEPATTRLIAEGDDLVAQARRVTVPA